MRKKLIQKLVEKSYNNGSLDAPVIDVIAKNLTRKDLKQYIKALKIEETKKYVTITSVSSLTEQEKKEIESLYPAKRYVYQTDQSLIAGIKIRTIDTEYELSINSIINTIKYYLVS